MNAEVIDLKYRRLYLRAIDGELNRWGRWIERNCDYQGYAGLTNVEAFLNGRGGGSQGHRILCLDMPTDVYATHARVLKCTEDQREAVWVFYAVRVKDDGTLWTLEERCKKFGITRHSMLDRVAQAKRRILGIAE